MGLAVISLMNQSLKKRFKKKNDYSFQCVCAYLNVHVYAKSHRPKLANFRGDSGTDITHGHRSEHRQFFMILDLT